MGLVRMYDEGYLFKETWSELECMFEYEEEIGGPSA